MAAMMEPELRADEGVSLRRVANLLGGAKSLRHSLSTPLEAHEMLMRGLPASALNHLLASLLSLHGEALLEKAVGMSVRTYQRRKDSPSKPLNAEQSGRTWKFAEILAKATDVFGSQEDAEHWFERPAMGLDQRRPIDLLATPAGVALVEDLLQRLEHGVYT
jgi:putative toxin-antitoxin system antitoxin component (TIGR02293 family)